VTDYAGEKVSVLITDVRNSLGVALTDDNVDSVTIVIYDAEGAEVQAEDDATWEATISGWVYEWDTTDVDAGRYYAEVRVNSVVDDPAGVEYLSMYLAASPVPVLVP
jgi:hypothetical protein